MKTTKIIKNFFLLFLLAAWDLNAGIGPALSVLYAAEAQGDKNSEKAYRIVPGDVLNITVLPATEYSREVTVQPDGKVELSLIGAILVKGLTARELQDLLVEKFSRYVASPQVTVNVRRFSGRRVAIIGEVHAPGYYEYRDGMRLLELVSTAGGLADNAKASKVRIIRQDASGRGSFRVNFNSVLKGDLSRDVALAPGDTVYVPKGKLTLGAQWTNANILPWLSLVIAVGTASIIIKQNK